MIALQGKKGLRPQRSRVGRLLVLALALTILGGCEPFPLHLDPLSVNGRDGGGDTPSYAALMRIGKAARDGGDYSNAVAVFRRAAEIEPRLPDPFVAIGDTLSALHSVNEAIVAYNSALARDRSCLPALQGLARAYIETGRPELALAPLNQALALSPDDPRLLVLLGVVEDVRGSTSPSSARLPAGSAKGARRPGADRRLRIVAGAERQLPECDRRAAAGRDGGIGIGAGTADLGADLRPARQHRGSGSARPDRSRRSRGGAQPRLLSDLARDAAGSARPGDLVGRRAAGYGRCVLNPTPPGSQRWFSACRRCPSC